MKLRLTARILLLVVLNVALLAAAVTVFLRAQYGTGWGSLLTYAAEDRVVSMALEVALEMGQAPVEDRDEILGRYAAAYGAPLYLFLNNGRQVGGPALELTEGLRRELSGGGDRPGPPPPPPPGKKGKGGKRPPRGRRARCSMCQVRRATGDGWGCGFQ